uniref:Prokineticin domain-containing protein n=1 Tax=Zonotrichia albicollis TaxID=44394 RepID=A0A8D2MCD9_ZONAL
MGTFPALPAELLHPWGPPGASSSAPACAGGCTQSIKSTQLRLCSHNIPVGTQHQPVTHSIPFPAAYLSHLNPQLLILSTSQTSFKLHICPSPQSES